jgi:hypothetical protein
VQDRGATGVRGQTRHCPGLPIAPAAAGTERPRRGGVSMARAVANLEARRRSSQRGVAPERSAAFTKPHRAAPSSGARVPRIAFCSDRSRQAAPLKVLRP